MNIGDLVRRNIRELKPYSSARDEFSGEAAVFLDANENPYPSLFNRYPDPLQKKLKQRISELKGVAAERIFLGNGSDEAIDLIIRAFCEPGTDAILIPEPTYGMYAVCADVNNVAVRRVSLTENFQLDVDAVLSNTDPSVKVIFLCSPNNPSGNLLDRDAILRLVREFSGIVVVDEAYIDFASVESLNRHLDDNPNLVILQTLSKAWGLAGLRLGMCFASTLIINILNKIKYPYNISSLTQQYALDALKGEQRKEAWVREILSERATLTAALNGLPIVRHIYPSDANFILVKMENARLVYRKLMELGTIVRDRSRVVLCENCLRITVGTPDENGILMRQLRELANTESTSKAKS
jgi:histidinol-phosphate aminotransferase